MNAHRFVTTSQPHSGLPGSFRAPAGFAVTACSPFGLSRLRRLIAYAHRPHGAGIMNFTKEAGNG